MADSFTVTGGAQIGWVNWSWPLARLSVPASALAISGGLIGWYRFTPEQVAALEPCGRIPIVGRGVRIRHSHPDYPSKIVFRSFQDPEHLIERRRRVPFLPRAAPGAVQIRRGIPVRRSCLLLLVVVWNALFLLDGFVPWKAPKAPGPLVLLALGLVFSAAVAIGRSAWLQSWVLKPGRSVGEIRAALSLLQLVTGLELVIFSVLVAFAWRAG